MKVYSGSYCMCDVGIPTGEVSMDGKELFTGDIVQLWHGMYLGEDFEEWYPSDGLTVITANQYISYSDGTIKINEENPKPFTMGIASEGVQSSEWKVKLVKSHKDLVEKERFNSFRINFK